MEFSIPYKIVNIYLQTLYSLVLFPWVFLFYHQEKSVSLIGKAKLSVGLYCCHWLQINGGIEVIKTNSNVNLLIKGTSQGLLRGKYLG